MNLNDYKEIEKSAKVALRQINSSKKHLDVILKDKMENGSTDEKRLFSEMMNDKEKLFKFVQGKGRHESDLKINEFLQKWQSKS